MQVYLILELETTIYKIRCIATPTKHTKNCGYVMVNNDYIQATSPSKHDRADRSICEARGARARHSVERTHLQLLGRPRHVARRRPEGGAPLAGLPPGSAGRRRRLAGRRDHEFDRQREAAAAAATRGLPPESLAAHKCTMRLQRAAISL